jgi:hypothetical protein
VLGIADRLVHIWRVGVVEEGVRPEAAGQMRSEPTLTIQVDEFRVHRLRQELRDLKGNRSSFTGSDPGQYSYPYVKQQPYYPDGQAQLQSRHDMPSHPQLPSPTNNFDPRSSLDSGPSHTLGSYEDYPSTSQTRYEPCVRPFHERHTS